MRVIIAVHSMKKTVILVTCILISTASGLFSYGEKKVVMGYCPSYSIDRISPKQMKSVSHLIYFALSPGPQRKIDSARLKNDMIKIRKKLNKAPVKVLVAVGGAKSGSLFVAVSQYKKSRENFINKIFEVTTKYSFDGIVIDWEYPEKDTEMNLFAVLLQELHAECRAKGMALAVTAPGWLALSQKAYASADYIHLMSYDRSGKHATYNQAVKDIEYHKQSGAPLKKICLGIPLYGRNYNNKDRAMSYRTILVRYRPPEGVDEVRGIYFNNLDTVKKKVSLVCEQGLAGVMLWELGQDSIENDRSIVDSVKKTIELCR